MLQVEAPVQAEGQERGQALQAAARDHLCGQVSGWATARGADVGCGPVGPVWFMHFGKRKLSKGRFLLGPVHVGPLDPQFLVNA